MKKVLLLVLVLSICLVFASCRNFNDDAVVQSTDLRTDAFCIIGFSSSNITQSPVITSDKGNPGDAYICIVGDDLTPIGDAIVISPGQSLTLDASGIVGSYTIQGKALETSGMYAFKIGQSD